jgi:hypothetical protein
LLQPLQELDIVGKMIVIEGRLYRGEQRLLVTAVGDEIPDTPQP